MRDPLLTLTTDFGAGSPYVAVLKGVLLTRNPSLRLLDLSHTVPPQDVRHAAYFLAEAVPFFAPGTIHLIVVDPGVGSERALLCVELAGQRLVLPDNGCWTPLADALGAAPVVYRLTPTSHWRQPVSATFHGRDILAPVAAALSLGVEPHQLGEPVGDWVRLAGRPFRETADRLEGEVVFVDHFGNLLTNIPAAQVHEAGRVRVGDQEVARRVWTYADVEPGTLVALTSSSAMLEIAVAQGSAAARLGVGVGTPVTVDVPSRN